MTEIFLPTEAIVERMLSLWVVPSGQESSTSSTPVAESEVSWGLVTRGRAPRLTCTTPTGLHWRHCTQTWGVGEGYF